MGNITVSKPYTNITTLFILLQAFFLSISISLSQITLGILLLCLIIFIIDNRYNILKYDIYFLLFFIYWIAAIFSTFFGSEYALFWKGLASPWPMLIFFVAYYFVNKNNFNNIVLAFAVGLLIMSISCLFYYYTLGQVDYRYFRSHSIVAPYMMTAHLLSIGIVFLSSVVISKVETRKKYIVFYIITIILSYYSLILTATRMPLFATTFILGLMFIIKLKWKGILLALLLFVAFIGYMILDPYMSSRFYNFFEGINNPATSHGWRLFLWKNSLVLLRDYPVFGIGEGAFETLIEPLMPKNVHLPLSHAHNSFVMHLVSYGIFGFVTFILFYGKIFVDLIKNFSLYPYPFIGLSVFIAYILEGLTENNFGLSLSSMQVLFMLGIICGIMKKQ